MFCQESIFNVFRPFSFRPKKNTVGFLGSARNFGAHTSLPYEKTLGKYILGGSFQYFSFSSLFGEMIQID